MQKHHITTGTAIAVRARALNYRTYPPASSLLRRVKLRAYPTGRFAEGRQAQDRHEPMRRQGGRQQVQGQAHIVDDVSKKPPLLTRGGGHPNIV